MTGYMAVRYDQGGAFSEVAFHDSVHEALDAAGRDGCRFVSVGEHPRALHTRHYVREAEGWREVGSDELDRLLTGPAPPTLFWGRAA